MNKQSTDEEEYSRYVQGYAAQLAGDPWSPEEGSTLEYLAVALGRADAIRFKDRSSLYESNGNGNNRPGPAGNSGMVLSELKTCGTGIRTARSLMSFLAQKTEGLDE